MSDARTDDTAHVVVATLLAAAGVHPGEGDLAILAGLYPAIRARMARLSELDVSDGGPVLLRWER